MKMKSFVVIMVSLLTAVLIASCSGKATTVTVPGATFTLPGTTTIIPPLTVTVPSGFSFLPTTPRDLSSHMDQVVDELKGQCLVCHGPGQYFQFPLPLEWDGSKFLSSLHRGNYIVIPGSLQDHTTHGVDDCLDCHARFLG